MAEMCSNGHISARRTANGQCRECSRNYVRIIRANNPDEAERQRKWNRKYHKDNREGISKRKKDFKITNRDAWRAHRSAYRMKLPVRAMEMLAAARFTSKKRGLPFDLDKNWILEKLKTGKCELTEISFDLTPLPDGRQNPFTASLDRIRPNLGYVKSNVRMILWALNAGLNTFGETVYAGIAKVYLEKHPIGTNLT